MTVDRFKLIAGPYSAPLFELGDIVTDELRGDVRITAISDSRISWPKGRRLNQKGGHAGLVLFADLERAVRSESNQAVCHWWGVTPQTVTKWRNALEVDADTPGTRKLRQEHGAQEWFQVVRGKAHDKSRNAEVDKARREKIAEARRGRKRPPQVVEALRKANLGKKHTAEARANMSKAQKKRGVIPPAAGRPWTAEEDALLEDCTIAEIVEKTGRTKVAVYSRRKTLNMTGNPAAGVPWTPEEDALVREFSVGEVMLKTGRTKAAVCCRRSTLGVTADSVVGISWTAEEDALLRKLSVADIVERTGRTKTAIYTRRSKLGMTGGH
jgi:hypothetical protein